MTAPRQPRWQRRKEARPAEIVSAALEVFAERGFAAARLDEVAARAGISKGTLYLYFPSKEDLFKAVVREAVLPRIAWVEDIAAHWDGPAPALLERILVGIGSGLANTPAGIVPKLVIAEAGNFPDLARFYFDEVIRRGLALLERVLARGMERGEFRPMDPEHAARVIVAPNVVLALWRSTFERFDGKPLDVEGHLRAEVAILIDGLRPRRSGGDDAR
jgi:AcrR family transcriptional regulator